MKKVLIIVLSSDFPPYDKMIETSMRTWDSVEVAGVETVFVCGQSTKTSTDKVIYLTVDNDLFSMGRKNLLALEGALANKEFDYICRANASHYINKKELLKYVQKLPEQNVFAGLVVDSTPRWLWGGGGFIISKDVCQQIIANKQHWRHDLMEDMAASYLITKLGIPYTNGIACSIDKMETCWRCMAYGTESFEFSDFADIKKAEGQYIFRVKQDYDRNMDEVIMKEMFAILK